MTKPIVHISHPGGHRASYRDLLATELGFETATGPARQFVGRLIRSPKVLFATLDGDIDRFLLIALARCLLFRPTAGLFIGPLSYTRRPIGIREKIRRMGLRVLRVVPLVTVFSIVPHPVRPELKTVTDDWIHDPQLWDLAPDEIGSLPETELSRQVEKRKGTRKVLLYLGQGSKRKGLSDLARLASGLEKDVLVVVAGKILEECREDVEELFRLGMVIEDRFISDRELLSLYGPADFTWCVYSPAYDQASGIFGRSLQLGVVPLIREGSVLDDYANLVHAEALRLKNVEQMAGAGMRALLLRNGHRVSRNRRNRMLRSFGSDAFRKLRKALGED